MDNEINDNLYLIISPFVNTTFSSFVDIILKESLSPDDALSFLTVFVEMLKLKLFELMINPLPDMEALPPEAVEDLISTYCDISRVAQEGLRDKLKAHADYVLKKDLSSYKVLYEMAKTGDPANADSLDESFSKLKKIMEEKK